MTKRRIISCISIAIATLVIVAVGVFMIRHSTDTPDRLLSLGEKYLTDLNYEQALVQFLKVIEIDPMNTRGYTGAAEAYVGLGQTEDAVAILRQGLERTGDDGIRNMLEEVHNTGGQSTNSINLVDVNSSENASSELELEGLASPLKREELTINGILLGEGTIHDFAVAFGNEITSGSNEDDDGKTVNGSVIFDEATGNPNTWMNQANGSDHVGYLQVYRNGAVGPRGIVIGETTEKDARRLLIPKESETDSMTFHFDNDSGKITFYIGCENDVVTWFLYVEDSFWENAENVD